MIPGWDGAEAASVCQGRLVVMGACFYEAERGAVLAGPERQSWGALDRAGSNSRGPVTITQLGPMGFRERL